MFEMSIFVGCGIQRYFSLYGLNLEHFAREINEAEIIKTSTSYNTAKEEKRVSLP